MPDADSVPYRKDSGTPGNYPVPADPASPALERRNLAERLADRIRKEGPLDFPSFMAAALYDPEDGYYARTSSQVGREGDFYTSVSTGPVFGRLLASHISAWHRGMGSPARWRIVEAGAHDATLARDIISALQESGDATGCEYATLEPLSALAEIQKTRLADTGIPCSVHASAEDLLADPLPTYLLGNELLDALVFHVVEADAAGGWQELGVKVEENAFHWMRLGPASPAITADLPVRTPPYRTEVRSGLDRFLAPLAALLQPGRMLWIDYGYSRSVYYDEARTEGTMRTYARHRAGDDPLDSPGERDITAHAEFTSVAEAIQALGGCITLFEDQGRCLTRLAHDWLLSLEGRVDAAVRTDLRAFQTLVHPAHLGARFHFLEASFGEGLTDSREALERLE